MTDKEIIKALECCGKPVDENSCSECPYHCYEEDCHKFLPQAIDLINRQKAEIERLEQELFDRSLTIETWKWEAIKEFAERLKKEYTETFLVSGDTVIEILDNLVKEMVGDAE